MHKLLNLQPPIPGYEDFIGAHLFTGERKALVDIGPKAAVPNLLLALVELHVSPQEIDYIILTHIHIDHAGGAGTAIREMGRANVVVHPRGRSHLVNPDRLWEASLKTLGELAVKYGKIEPVPEDRIMVATDGMKLDLGDGVVLEIYLTPGHAAHHLSVFDRANGVLVAGEAAGVCVNGNARLATPPPFKLEETLASLDKLIALEPGVMCYGHFGCYEQAVERLRRSRQTVLDWYEFINLAAKEGKSPEDILAMLREKDKSLDYLGGLNRDEYNREHALLLNSVNGMYQSIRQSG